MYNGYIESQSQTDARRARMEGWMQQREIMKQVIADVAPRLNLFLEVCGDIDAGNGELFPIEAGGADVQDAVRWQDETIFEAITPNGGSKTINLNGYKATATASWRERHWNEGA